jgi:hypothetical protein
MDRAEVERYVATAGGVVVDARSPPALPGLVRTVQIRKDMSVVVEFDSVRAYVEMQNESPVGPKMRGRYKTMDALVLEIEAYLGLPIAQWHNFTRLPYEPPSIDDNWQPSIAQLEDLVRAHQLPLPKGARFIHQSIYWKQIEKYGSYSYEQEVADRDNIEADLLELLSDP